MSVNRVMDQTVKGSRNPGGRPARMSREAILREARRIPASTLTLPLIAKRLGVKTASLYYHFESRDALLTALSAQLIGELEVLPADPAHWRNWLASEVKQIHRFLLANPIVLEAASWPLIARASTTLVETALETLVGAGFDPQDALLVWSAAANFAFVQAHVAHNAPAEALTRCATKAALADIGEDRPHLRAAAAALSGRNPATLVDESIDRFAALLADPAPLPSPRRRRR